MQKYAPGFHNKNILHSSYIFYGVSESIPLDHNMGSAKSLDFSSFLRRDTVPRVEMRLLNMVVWRNGSFV